MNEDLALDTAPPDVRAAAVEHGLGETYVRYEAAVSRAGVSALQAVFVSAVALSLAAGSVSTGSVFVGVLALVFGLAAVLSIVGAVKAAAAVGNRVYLFPSGFVHTGRDGVRVFRYDDITVRREVSTDNVTTQSSFTVERPDGARLVVNSSTFWGSLELGQEIERRVVQAQFAPVVAAVAEGRTVEFGPLAVDLRGLHERGEVVPWNQVRGFQVRQGATHVRTAPGFRVGGYSVQKVPNVFVLAAVAETLRHAATADDPRPQ